MQRKTTQAVLSFGLDWKEDGAPEEALRYSISVLLIAYVRRGPLLFKKVGAFQGFYISHGLLPTYPLRLKLMIISLLLRRVITISLRVAVSTARLAMAG